MIEDLWEKKKNWCLPESECTNLISNEKKKTSALEKKKKNMPTITDEL